MTKKPMPWENTLPTPLTPAVAEPLVKVSPYDGDAFASFYERSARSLWAYLARVSSDPALADDLVQESYLRFLSSDRLEQFLAEGEQAARRYLFRIGSNLLHDYWRKPQTATFEDTPEEAFACTDDSQAAEHRILLGPALRQLRPRDRQLLWLAYAEGYSHKEIAEATGLASASVRLLLFRARHRISKLLGAGLRINA